MYYPVPKATGSTKQRRDEISRVRRKRQKEDNIELEKQGICPQYPEEYKIQRGSILKIWMKFSKKKTSGKHQISGKESH